MHVLKILGMMSLDWIEAPLKWQVLDIVYLMLDVAVVLGLPIASRIGFCALFTAGISQIVLYTVLRAWIIDVPEPFVRSPEDVAYLDTLVAFHVITLALVGSVIWLNRNFGRRRSRGIQ